MELDNLTYVGTVIQAVGLSLLALLSYVLARALPRDHSRHWAAAWSMAALAVVALFFSFQVTQWQRLLQFGYFFGEYAFGLLLLAGLRRFARGQRPTQRELLWLLPAALVAAPLAAVPGPFSLRFAFQAGALATIFALGFALLWPLRRGEQAGLGLNLTLGALALLTLNFGQYVPVILYVERTGAALPGVYRYNSIVDLLLEVMLVFGTLTLTLEASRRQLEQANAGLREAQGRLEQLARQDALTEALNRHAFHALVESERRSGAAPGGGSVVLVDIDDLKPINDRLGHSAGDAVIRQTATAIRSLVRSDDLVFRWGGDEFLALLFGVPEAEAQRRFQGLDALLKAVPVPGTPDGISVRVSVGVAALQGEPLEEALARADAAMYRRKHERKSSTPPAEAQRNAS